MFPVWHQQDFNCLLVDVSISQRKWEERKASENLRREVELCYGFLAINMKQGSYQEQLGDVLLKRGNS